MNENKTRPAININEDEFELVLILDKPALFTNGRVHEKDIPEGLFIYDLRAPDEGDASFCSIEKHVTVNHAGSIITKEPIDLGDNDCITFNENDDMSPDFIGTDCTVNDFIAGNYELE